MPAAAFFIYGDELNKYEKLGELRLLASSCSRSSVSSLVTKTNKHTEEKQKLLGQALFM